MDQLWKEKIRGDNINSTISESNRKFSKSQFDPIKEEEEANSSIEEISYSSGHEKMAELNRASVQEEESKVKVDKIPLKKTLMNSHSVDNINKNLESWNKFKKSECKLSSRTFLIEL